MDEIFRAHAPTCLTEVKFASTREPRLRSLHSRLPGEFDSGSQGVRGLPVRPAAFDVDQRRGTAHGYAEVSAHGAGKPGRASGFRRA
ncbi:hypothetical protein BTH42_13015 [Burkholderia sp. SRS-W-2-2016]|nr:hypothetical protein BTH42_13015 [Burkholderia sp. SRS-W-2-2016]